MTLRLRDRSSSLRAFFGFALLWIFSLASVRSAACDARAAFERTGELVEHVAGVVANHGHARELVDVSPVRVGRAVVRPWGERARSLPLDVFAPVTPFDAVEPAVACGETVPDLRKARVAAHPRRVPRSRGPPRAS